MKPRFRIEWVWADMLMGPKVIVSHRYVPMNIEAERLLMSYGFWQIART